MRFWGWDVCTLAVGVYCLRGTLGWVPKLRGYRVSVVQASFWGLILPLTGLDGTMVVAYSLKGEYWYPDESILL